MSYFDICCICTAQTRLPISLNCEHKYCEHCHRHLELLSEGSIVDCPICLKSSRQPIQKPRVNQRLRAQSSFNNFYKSAKFTTTKTRDKDRLYCFNCQSVFSTNDYINGNHRSHRVKTQQEACSQLQQQHLRSLKILQCKIQDYMKKQVSLQKQLQHSFQKYKQTKDQIGNYFDNFIILIQKQRDNKLIELQEIYNDNVQTIADNLKQLKSSLKKSADCGKVIKQFICGDIAIDELQRKAIGIKQELEMKSYKINVPILPRLIESYDLAFYVKNCLNFVNGEVQNNTKQQISMDNKSQQDTDIQSQSGIPRKVRLVERVKNQLNPGCRFIKDDYFLFQL